MKVKTSELVGPALALAVFIAEGRSYWTRKHAKFDINRGCTDWVLDTDGRLKRFRFDESFSRAGVWVPEAFFEPDQEWSQGGPIIERDRIYLTFSGFGGVVATKFTSSARFEGIGSTCLIAAMRCYVASKLGDEVDIPEELS